MDRKTAFDRALEGATVAILALLLAGLIAAVGWSSQAHAADNFSYSQTSQANSVVVSGDLGTFTTIANYTNTSSFSASSTLTATILIQRSTSTFSNAPQSSHGNFAPSVAFLAHTGDGTCQFRYFFTQADINAMAAAAPGFATFTFALPQYAYNASSCAYTSSNQWSWGFVGLNQTTPGNYASSYTYRTATAAAPATIYILIGAASGWSNSYFNVLTPNTNPDTSISTTTYSTAVNFSANYFVNSSSTQATLYNVSTTKYLLNLNRLDQASTSAYTLAATGPTDTVNALSTTITLPSGSVWKYSWTRYDPGAIFPSTLQSGTYSLAVVSNALLSQFGLTDLGNTSGLAVGTTTASAPCGITQIQGCFQNALVYLFYPSTASLSQFSNVWTSIEYKPPFGYVIQTITAVQAVNDTGAPTFYFGTSSTMVLPFQSVIFSPIRAGLAALLWLLFAIVFYMRLKHLDI